MEIRYVRCQDYRHTAALLRYLDYLLEKIISLITQVKTKHMQRVLPVSSKRHTSIPVTRHSSSNSHIISHCFPNQLSHGPWLFMLVYNYFFPLLCCQKRLMSTQILTFIYR